MIQNHAKGKKNRDGVRKKFDRRKHSPMAYPTAAEIGISQSTCTAASVCFQVFIIFSAVSPVPPGMSASISSPPYRNAIPASPKAIRIDCATFTII